MLGCDRLVGANQVTKLFRPCQSKHEKEADGARKASLPSRRTISPAGFGALNGRADVTYGHAMDGIERGQGAMADRIVLVTGGAGYIGSHICKALAQAGYTPVTYDNLVFGHEWAVKWGPLEKGDVLDHFRLSEVIRKHAPFAVIHCAAFAYVGESVIDPAKYYRNNVLGALTLLEAMRAHDLDRIVFSSTCATYGIPKSVPVIEDAVQSPINPYGASKLMVERMLADFGAAYGLNSIALRYFNAAGADPDGEIGEDHQPETHLIPLVLAAAAGVHPDFTMFGDDYDTPDGTCIRDYAHVSDLAEAHVLSLKRLQQGNCRPAYNLGTGEGVSVAQVIDAAEQVTGRSIRVVKGRRRAGDPAALIASPARAMDELGWRPRHLSIADMVSTAWDWSWRRWQCHGEAPIRQQDRPPRHGNVRFLRAASERAPSGDTPPFIQLIR